MEYYDRHGTISSRPKDSDRTFQECRSSSVKPRERERMRLHERFFLRDVRRVTLLFDSMGICVRGIEFLTSQSLKCFLIAIFVMNLPLSLRELIRIERIRVARIYTIQNGTKLFYAWYLGRMTLHRIIVEIEFQLSILVK